MTHIVAGRLGGRRITAPRGRATRPTSDRVREAYFATLATLLDLDGARFADLYAGSGAVGLEAASRGAVAVLLVESDPRAAAIVRANIGALELAQTCRLVVAKVDVVLAAGVIGPPYHAVFADPPYQVPQAEVTAMLAALVGHGWLAEGAVVTVERSSRSPEPDWVAGLTGQRSRRYGESILWYGRAS